MPLNAIDTGMVDDILAPEDMFAGIKGLLNTTHENTTPLSVDLREIFNILQSRTGNDFSGYKTSVMNRRIERQLRRLHMNNLSDYVRYLRLNLDEIDILFKDLLIGVTCFFRDPEAFVELKQIILPSIIKHKPTNFTFRAWVPGCSTGQEAYSIAILLREYMKETNRYFHVQLFCTDIDQTALETARLGVYPASITKEVSPERLSTYFIKEKNTYKITKEIREMIVFGVQNIIQDPPFTKVDFISCRNLLIYLSAISQRILFPLLHFSLKPEGILFLGKSESASQYRHLFKPCENKYKFFSKIDYVDSRYKLVNPVIKKHLLNLSSFLPNQSLIANHDMDFDHLVNLFLIDAFVSPCVVTNKQGNIIYNHGELSDYLNVNDPLINRHLLDLTLPHIKTILTPYFSGSAGIKAKKSLTKVLLDPVSKSFFIHLTIMPIHHIDGLTNLLFIRFDKVLIEKNSLIKDTNVKNRLIDMEQELHLTKETLQSTIEELEASNEEMQSTNEEIQSINEELETSKEELQAVNEELLIVNTELQNRIEETSAINEDMSGLFNNANIAAVFLDNSLKIKQFTPRTQELIHLFPADVGRPFKHFATNIQQFNLNDISADVLQSHKQQMFEAQSTDGRWYRMNISPYHISTKFIGGVVITFMDITQHKLNEEKLIKIENKLRDTDSILDSVLDLIQQSVMVLDCDLRIVSLNELFCQQFFITQNEVIGQLFYDVSDAAFNIPTLCKCLEQVIKDNHVVEKYEMEHDFPRAGHKKLIMNIRKIVHPDSRDLILLTIDQK